jgi:hypothetical protein
MREMGRARRRYVLSGETIERLRDAYAAPNYPELVKRLEEAARASRLPRRALTLEARRRGWSSVRHPKSWRRWTAEDDAKLREAIGHHAAITIAKEMGRSVEAVRSRAYDLGLMTRIADGYGMDDVAECMGVGRAKAASWIASGLLKVHQGRVTTESMERFLRAHAHRYDLRRVDQVWFKSIVFAKR